PQPLVKIDRPLPRWRFDDTPYSFLKIADGCDHTCAFCAIPGMKGPYTSVPRDILLNEARGLIDTGVREINIIAQDIAPYGKDLYPDYHLPDLLEELCAIDGDFWIRLLYLYPGGITDRFLEVFASQDKICKYLDIPLQHLDPVLLKAMRRPAGEVSTERLIARIRQAVPDVVLRTTLILGFPGETNQSFQKLLRGIEQLRFDWIGTFCYSPEEDTAAYEMAATVSRKTAERRQLHVIRNQEMITLEKQMRHVGKILRVLVESISEDRTEAHGRSWREAPDVDGEITLYFDPDAPNPPRPGDFINARIIAAEPYDLFAEPA
ncbi:MiaB/RimO family radical SAM methylthiotransferase, partial [bacterium]|nr:MiaB/RimO family radical SAM methylthiotransferase [bacterium]